MKCLAPIVRRAALTLLAGLVLLLAAGAAADATPGDAEGRPLEEVLLELQAAGLRLVFTDQVVRPELRVRDEPTSSRPRDVLDEVLAPHGLTVREGPGDVLVVIVDPAALDVPPHSTDDTSENQEIPASYEEIDVTAGRLRILGDALSSVSLEPQEILALPQIGEDVLRPLKLLPGTSGNDFSAELHVRGGRQDEILVRLDGLEILEPFHLKDFGGALSILLPSTLERLELSTGGFSAEHGDRMAGVLDLTTLDPDGPTRSELGLSVVDLRATSSGNASDGRLDWLAAARGGLVELPLKVAEEEENPRFWDFSGKLGVAPGPGQSLRGQVLLSGDHLDFEAGEDEEDLERFRTTYENTYLWLTHEAIPGRHTLLETRLSWSRIERDRTGMKRDAAGLRTLDDARRLDVLALAHDVHRELGERHELKGGLEVRTLETEFDYFNLRQLDDPLATIRHESPSGATRFAATFTGEQYSLYMADRWRPSPSLLLEIGLRFDENTILDNEHVSPRFNLDLALGSHSRLRFAWGFFYQSQRLYELQVEDGETEYQSSERAEHRILGFEHEFGTDGGHFTFRAELYERRVADPRRRFENLFDPVSILPELEPDRLHLAPTSARAHGLELFLSGRTGRRLKWFTTYTYARIKDVLEGRDVPRAIDQPHTLRLDLGYESPWAWHFDLVVELRSGWPTTALDARAVEGPDGELVIEPVLGPLHGERLPDYRRLDLRASRRFTVRRGELEFFAVVQNLTAERNVRGFDIRFEPIGGENVRVIRNEKFWGRILPSLGLRWRF